MLTQSQGRVAARATVVCWHSDSVLQGGARLDGRLPPDPPGLKSVVQPLTKYCTKVLDLMHRCSSPMVMMTNGQQPWQWLLLLLGRRWHAHSLLEGCLGQARTWQPVCGLVRGRWHVYMRNTIPQRDAVATLDASRCVTLTVRVALDVREVPLVHATLLVHVALEVHEALMAVVVLYGLCAMRSCTHTDLVLVAATQDAIAGDGGQYTPHHDEVPLRYPGVEGRHLSVGDVMAVTRCRALDKSAALLCMMSGLLEAAMVAQANTTLKHHASWLWSALDHSPWVEPTYSADRHSAPCEQGPVGPLSWPEMSSTALSMVTLRADRKGAVPRGRHCSTNVPAGPEGHATPTTGCLRGTPQVWRHMHPVPRHSAPASAVNTATKRVGFAANIAEGRGVPRGVPAAGTSHCGRDDEARQPCGGSARESDLWVFGFS
ncbi:hypothetical protein PHYSODRAFT_332079 [Phytophthora sojae]|uniref:Uncharacterized protein n=1 Tax=Phytophthora sojae (strain P6497) TaxID=1094619 RepID=G4ZJN0_PHYSP|nr:hypothetical protein PHYSODRAFT_332079 [Phytophthora sojae]EGZ18250.1 hypothetical protein PHYSODRAFT_332079 [Phytophthora sojae]|eukprot:XP_009527308.1 hypothetical protein PHYSODRAFT_332079 [Phytophthora sojae]